jgi:hypothetical protein
LSELPRTTPSTMSTTLTLNENAHGSLKLAVSVGFLHFQQVAWK